MTRELLGRLSGHDARLERDATSGVVTLIEDPRHPLPADLREEVERRLGDPAVAAYLEDLEQRKGARHDR